MKENALIELYKNHNKWINIVKKMGATDLNAEDLVMDMYIKVDKANRNTQIKSISVYAYFVLRNLYYDYYKARRKIETINIDDIQIDSIEDFCIKTEIEQSNEIDNLCNAKQSLDWINNGAAWYNNQVVNLHYGYLDSKNKLVKGISMRELSRETGISLSSIFNTIKNFRIKLREQLNEK